MRRQTNQWLIPIFLAIGVAGALWYFRTQLTAPETAAPVTVVPEELPPAPGPAHPIETQLPVADERRQLVPLPPLAESDEYFKLGIADAIGTGISEILVKAELIEKLVATIDNLPRAHVAARIRPVIAINGLFLVDGQDASGEYAMSSANFARYDELIDLLERADLSETMDLYRRFYPLFQKAYENLGYPNGYFNDRLVEVVDHLLEAPDVSGPLELVRPHVLYEFRDEDLEALSSGQKHILRLGEDHAAIVKRRLRELRTLLTTM